MMKSYEEVLKMREKKNVAIFGAGPSLYSFLKSPYGPQNNPLFAQMEIMVVNSAIMAFSWDKNEGSPTGRYWISNDALCRRWTWWKQVLKANCIKIVRNSWKKYYDEIPDFYIFHPRETTEDVIDPDGKGLAYCSSIPTAIDLAIQMGFKKIFLFGVDHKEKDRKTHFWQYYPKERWPKQLKPAQGPFKVQKQVFELNKVAYKALGDFADNKKTKIYNCNTEDGTDVKQFKIIHFKEIKKCL